MRTYLSIVFIFLLLISNYIYSNEIKIYNCNINLSTNIKNISPLEMSAPAEIKIVYNLKTNNLIDYIWNKKSVVDRFRGWFAWILMKISGSVDLDETD